MFRTLAAATFLFAAISFAPTEAAACGPYGSGQTLEESRVAELLQNVRFQNHMGKLTRSEARSMNRTTRAIQRLYQRTVRDGFTSRGESRRLLGAVARAERKLARFASTPTRRRTARRSNVQRRRVAQR